MGSGDEHRSVGVDGPKRGPRSRVPLFARLCDDEPRRSDEAQPQRVLTRDRVLDSVRGELSRLLNTRCSETIDGLQGQERTALNYGLPDFFTLNPGHDGDRQRLARLIVEAVRAYEPRLHQPVVEVVPDAVNGRTLRVTLTGMLVVEQLSEPVSFPLVIAERGGPIRAA